MIAVCTPIRDRVNPGFMRSLMEIDLLRPWVLLDAHGYGVANSRNLIAQEAMNIPKVTHLLWIDDDAVFPPDAARKLLAHDMMIVGGLCFGRKHPYPPILLHKDRDPKIGYRYEYDYPRGLVEVDAIGMHFALIKREVFESITRKLKPGEGPFTERALGEDVSMCERARECGYRIMADTTVEIGHIGSVIVNSTFAKRNRDCEVNPWKMVR